MRKRAMFAACTLAISGTLLAAVSAQAGENTDTEGKVLNIYAWNEEFLNRMEDFYPGYEIVDNSTGMIGDVTVRWNIISAENNEYQNTLDEILLNQKNAQDDDKADIFLIEEDYARKYVDSDYTLSLSELGITEANNAGQFAFTRDVVSDSEGNVKGTAWMACPGVLIYNREIAREVLGTDDPKKVQEALSDWDGFLSAADTMKEAGYSMTASVYDTYRVFAGNVSGGWVEDGVLQVDENIRRWAELSGTMLDKGETTLSEMWSEDWNSGFYPEENVFCFFGPQWFYEYCMEADAEGSIAGQGGWAAAEGPQSFFWGGTWICAAKGTDNASLIKKIMLKLTCDKEILTGIARTSGDFVNHVSVIRTLMEEEDESFSSDILGGQNPISVLLSNAGEASGNYISSYDYVCSREYQAAMKEYFEGTKTYEEAEEEFYQAVLERYPDLSR